MKPRILLALSLSTFLNAQTIQTTIQEVINTNPTILEKLKNYNVTKEDIVNAESGYYPKIDVSLGGGYESKPVGVNGEMAYDNALTYTQNLFNGFTTTYKVLQQEHRTIAASYSYVETVNDTAFNLLNHYLQVMKNQELLTTAKENIEINEEIFVKVQKLYESGLTTLSEVNKIESSLSLAKSNYVVQENTLLDVTYNMKRILGRFLDPKKMSKPDFNTQLPDTLELASKLALTTNPSLLVSNYNIKLAQATFKEKQAPYYPSIDVEIKNTASNYTEEHTDSFRAMAYVKYNIFNGFADDSALQQSKSKIHQEVEVKNNLSRQVLEGLELSWAANVKLDQQMEHLKAYKDFSLKTLTLYSKEYDLGRRSLLDLLAAQNDFIGSKSQIINTEYSLLFAKYRILDAMGTLVPNIINSTDTIYSNVGLKNKSTAAIDTLPVKLDKDNDLIADDRDICANSLPSTMKDIFGCENTFENIFQIERYTGFTFSNDTNLSDDGYNNLKKFIEQIKQYDLNNLKIDILGNVNQELNEKKLLHVSKQRAEIIKDMLVATGINKYNITIRAQSNKVPLYSDETSNGIKLNNRVDIILKKLKK